MSEDLEGARTLTPEDAQDGRRCAALLGCSIALTRVDLGIADRISENKSDFTPALVLSEGASGITAWSLALGMLLYGVRFQDCRVARVGSTAVKALAGAFITMAALKLTFRRERPHEGSGEGRFFRPGGRSFPSGHSIHCWTIASVMAHGFGELRKPESTIVTAAAIFTAGRIRAGEHFLSDVFAGGVMGWYIGKFAVRHSEQNDPLLSRMTGTGDGVEQIDVTRSNHG